MTDIHEGLIADFPLMWEMSGQFDFAERMGGCTEPLMAEVDRAMRELWDARRQLANVKEPF